MTHEKKTCYLLFTNVSTVMWMDYTVKLCVLSYGKKEITNF